MPGMLCCIPEGTDAAAGLDYSLSHTGSLLQSASWTADFCPVSTESECSAMISTMWSAVFYSGKHVVWKPLSIHFQHIPQFHGVTHLFTEQPPENPPCPWASALCGTCVGMSPLEKSLTPHHSCLWVLNHTSPRAPTAQKHPACGGGFARTGPRSAPLPPSSEAELEVRQPREKHTPFDGDLQGAGSALNISEMIPQINNLP